MTRDEHPTKRIVLVFADDTAAAEDVQRAIDMAQQNPWRPLPKGANVNTAQQERFSDEATDELIIAYLRRAAPRLHIQGSVIIP